VGTREKKNLYRQCHSTFKGTRDARTDSLVISNKRNETENKSAIWISHCICLIKSIHPNVQQCKVAGWLSGSGRGTAGYSIKALTFWKMPQSTLPRFGEMRNVRSNQIIIELFAVSQLLQNALY
jgi:hypothetical protein